MKISGTTLGKKYKGGDPPKTPPSPSYSSSSSSSYDTISSSTSTDAHKKHFDNSDMNIPLLKLEIKYNFPMSNGEVNAEKLDYWVRKIEVYCRIQKLEGDEAKIHLASLRLGGNAIV